MIVEMHCHTSEHSACSHVAAAELVRRAHEMGIHAIVLTDHHYQWRPEELEDLRHRACLPEICHLMTGQEVDTRDFGHVLVYGAPETIERQDITVQQIRERFNGVAIVWAHPYRDGREPQPDRLLSPLIDAVEIFSSNHSVSEAMQALRDYHTHKFVAIGGTDAHAYSYAGTYPTLFDHPFDSIEGLVTELKAGRCRPYFKEVPRTGTSHTTVKEVTVGPKAAEMREKMVVKTFDNEQAWQAGERTHYIVDKLREHGFDKGPYRAPRPLDGSAQTLSLMEERISGKSLFDTLVQADANEAPKYLEKAAIWLAGMHNARLELTPKDEYPELEPDRLNNYVRPLIENRHRHLDRVQQIREHVITRETDLLSRRPEIMVQGHGDYHPKNILVAQETHDDGEYVAAIDFHSSYQLPRAFDVGTFLAQYINMFFDYRDVQRHAPAEIFLRAYYTHAEELEEDFTAQMELYKARTCLSILYYLTKVGMGDSENFWRVMVEAEKCLASFEARGVS